jgi:tripartite-type tricarboxylate transporter receptor subunit TctC
MSFKHCARIAMGVFMATALSVASAQTFPSQPVRLVVTFPPGGASDLMGRLMGQKIGEQWKQTVLIENRPGAAGAIGTEYAARQPADGYTFMMGNMGPTLITPLLTKVPFDLNKDFKAVSLIATGPCVVVVNSKSPYKTLEDLVTAARTKPINFGSGGAGTMAQLVGEMINHSAKVKMQHVPYKGGISAINDLLAGMIDMVAADPQAVIQHIKAGNLRAIAVTSEKRFTTLPDVPSFAEKGMADIVALNSWGVYLPAATPKAIVDQYTAVLNKVMVDPDLVKRFNELGVDALHSTAPELQAFNASEISKFGKIIKDQGIKAD